MYLYLGMPEMVYLVPELCRLTGLTDEERNNFNFMKSLADYTKVGPVGRIKKLMEFSRRIQNAPAISKELADWDLKFSNKIVEFEGRVLPSEKISQGPDRSQTHLAEQNGDFTKLMRDKQMVSNGVMNRWVVVVPSNLKSDTRNLVTSMQRAANGMGFTIPHPQVCMQDRGSNHFKLGSKKNNRLTNIYVEKLILGSRNER